MPTSDPLRPSAGVAVGRRYADCRIAVQPVGRMRGAPRQRRARAGVPAAAPAPAARRARLRPAAAAARPPARPPPPACLATAAPQGTRQVGSTSCVARSLGPLAGAASGWSLVAGEWYEPTWEMWEVRLHLLTCLQRRRVPAEQRAQRRTRLAQTWAAAGALRGVRRGRRPQRAARLAGDPGVGRGHGAREQALRQPELRPELGGVAAHVYDSRQRRQARAARLARGVARGGGFFFFFFFFFLTATRGRSHVPDAPGA